MLLTTICLLYRIDMYDYLLIRMKCIEKNARKFGINEIICDMLGQRVDKAQKGLVIYKGRKYVNK